MARNSIFIKYLKVNLYQIYEDINKVLHLFMQCG